jgi:hypothetical protein
MSSGTFWVGFAAVIWGAMTPLMAQREPPLQAPSEKGTQRRIVQGLQQDSQGRPTQVGIVDDRWQRCSASLN